MMSWSPPVDSGMIQASSVIWPLKLRSRRIAQVHELAGPVEAQGAAAGGRGAIGVGGLPEVAEPFGRDRRVGLGGGTRQGDRRPLGAAGGQAGDRRQGDRAHGGEGLAGRARVAQDVRGRQADRVGPGGEGRERGLAAGGEVGLEGAE